MGFLALGYLETAQQAVHLLLKDFLCRPFGQNAAGTNVVEIVQELRRVLFHLLGVYGLQGLNRLLLKTYIIIIGGIDNGKLCLGIEQPAALALVQQVALFVDAVHACDSTLTEVIEVLVARAALTKAHLLNIAHQHFQLIVSQFRNLVQQLPYGLIVHFGHQVERTVVDLCCLAVTMYRQTVNLVAIVFH